MNKVLAPFYFFGGFGAPGRQGTMLSILQDFKNNGNSNFYPLEILPLPLVFCLMLGVTDL